MSSINRGIQMGAGANFTAAGDVSFGNTTIVESAAERLRRQGADDAAARLAEVERLLGQHRAALRDADELLGTLRSLAGELAGAAPNRTTLRGLLAGLAGGVGSVATLADAVQRLHAAIPGI
jgi:hypothetical protein